MKTPMVSSATSFQRLQTSLQSPMPRLPRSNVYSTRDPANPSASVHRKRFFTPSLTLKFLCAGCLNPGPDKKQIRYFYMNRVMAQSVMTGMPIPLGAIIVLEVYGAKVDDGGRVVLDSGGNLVSGPLNVISVMETIK